MNLVIVCLLSGLRRLATEKASRLYELKDYSAVEITELTRVMNVLYISIISSVDI